ncbi:VCBS repeat-containing protein [Arthrobacter sp. fls2-241-R2A-172]|uniref:VCBS repeat-containing protein n=1 Tax=Arthrobacter sp. fls2-241-R2A-172 TaxID=3040325 RepID=UPI002551AE08|nr:VCBS repeat-containing protein [Arthrobacter sp. fls2-241-R2A-172]
MKASKRPTSGVRRIVAGFAAAVVAAMAVSPAPAMATMDPDNPVIHGAPYVGSTLTLEIEPGTYSGCGAAAGPDYRVYWTRDGVPATDHPNFYQYTLDVNDRGKTIAAHVVASQNGCDPQEVSSEETAPIAASNRANGFTGRGAHELLARRTDGTLMLYSRVNNTWESPRTVGPGWNGFTTVLSPGDFTGDGVNDILARDAAGNLFVYAGTGNGGFYAGRQVGSGWNAFTMIVAPGDFNGDGANDLLARDANGLLYLYPGNGKGGWLARSLVGSGWNVVNKIITPGDFNGDSAVDVLARDTSGALRLYRGNGGGGFTTMSVVGQGWGGMGTIGSAGDIDGNGNVDVYAVDSSGQLMAYYGDGDGGWNGSGVIGWGWGGFTALF